HTPRAGAVATRGKLTRLVPALIFPAVMTKPHRGDAISLAIDDLAFGGEGVGRVNGYVIFVRGGLPGDRLKVRVVEARARFGRAGSALTRRCPMAADAGCCASCRCARDVGRGRRW